MRRAAPGRCGAEAAEEAEAGDPVPAQGLRRSAAPGRTEKAGHVQRGGEPGGPTIGPVRIQGIISYRHGPVRGTTKLGLPAFLLMEQNFTHIFGLNRPKPLWLKFIVYITDMQFKKYEGKKNKYNLSTHIGYKNKQ